MKHVNNITIKHIIHDFKQVAIAGKPQKKVFVFLIRHGIIKHSLFESVSDIRFKYPMFEGALLEGKLFFHASKYNHENKVTQVKVTRNTPAGLRKGERYSRGA